MRRRLRKKTRRGEFREDGFAFAVLTPGGVDIDMIDPILEEADAGGLAIGGGGRAAQLPGMACWSFYVTKAGRGGITESERQEFLDRLWAAVGRYDIRGIVASPLHDACYDVSDANVFPEDAVGW